MTQRNFITLSRMALHLTHVRRKSSDFAVNCRNAVLLRIVHAVAHRQRSSLPDECDAGCIRNAPRNGARDDHSIAQMDLRHDLLFSNVPDNNGKIRAGTGYQIDVVWTPSNCRYGFLVLRLDRMQQIITRYCIPLQQQ